MVEVLHGTRNADSRKDLADFAAEISDTLAADLDPSERRAFLALREAHRNASSADRLASRIEREEMHVPGVFANAILDAAGRQSTSNESAD